MWVCDSSWLLDRSYTISAAARAVRLPASRNAVGKRLETVGKFVPVDQIGRLTLFEQANCIVDASETVEYLHRRTEITSTEPIMLDTTRSSFVRLEAYSNPQDLTDRAATVIMTNPIILLRD